MAEYVNPDTLVDTDWVAAHGDDDGVRLVEVDVDTTSYDSGHVSGAVGWNWETQLSDGIQRDIASPEQWKDLLESSGISADTHVILYGDNNNWFAAFAYWQFKLAGHDRVSLMNGGRLKWEQEGRELTTAPSDVEHSSYAAGDANPSLRVLQPDVRAAVGDGSTVMVDVRSPAEFTGEILAPPGLAELAQRGGHIPGADNVPWLTAVNEADGTFKSADELHEIYGARGATGDAPVITYCRIGERSAHTWFALHELLGVGNVRNYDGSWTEWGSMIGMPIER
jgi:thiosulfate/3-mercaptopyruvate sulfurtransferase